MNMTQKVAASFVAVAAVSAFLFSSANAVSMKSAQSANANPSSVVSTPAIAPLNSPETPAAQLNDLQYN